MTRDEAELASRLAVRGGDERAECRLARLPTVFGVRHAPTLEDDETAPGVQDQQESAGFGADRDRLGELLDLENAERALKRPGAVRADRLETRHARRRRGRRRRDDRRNRHPPTRRGALRR